VRFDRHAYGHTAIAARLTATQPHQGIAHQWFRAPDVLALLPFDRPLAERSFALVWSLPQERAAALMQMEAAAFEAELQNAAVDAPAELRLGGERSAWPLAIAGADPVCGAGWVLVGDAAHVVHPLAGQGLNLGLRDAFALVQALRDATSVDAALRRIEWSRAPDRWSMIATTDFLARSFTWRGPGLALARGGALALLNAATPVKSLLARQMMFGRR